ncbi:hypothetical protein Bhyg_09417 [Pseudolycoriella hygida]|uniref:Uncharacterized protein n=1 Tax=Pseudolycoriella hygida TaxID=35572 RepID=A0A9Q0N6J2_9DIPT|nr:hypothetical protein Bhyg_09417 [Pseudolycoriella hygida]
MTPLPSLFVATQSYCGDMNRGMHVTC